MFIRQLPRAHALTCIIFTARVNVKMAATRKAIEEFSPISGTKRLRNFSSVFFLEMIHISLKQGSSVEATSVAVNYLFNYISQKSLHLGMSFCTRHS